MTEIEQRRQALGARLAGLKIDALLITSPANIRYLSDFAGSNAVMLVTAGESHFFTDPRYEIEATKKITGKVHIAKGPLMLAASAVIKRKRLKKIGFEASWLRYDEAEKLKQKLPPGAGLHPIGRVVEELRMIKSHSEIALIRKSVLVNSEAFSRTVKRVKPGMREREIAAELEFQMRVLGAEKAAFETIVAAGARAALPHAHPTGHRLEKNELLLIDMGASLEGYSSDMTRVVHLGAPARRIREMYKAVLDAQLSAIDAVRPGVTAGNVDKAARDVLKRYKLDREFVHSTGHGLGLEIHELPRIGRKDQTQLRAGMAITVEPGVYIDGLGGIRIEDTVLVTETGCEILTPTSKEFVNL